MAVEISFRGDVTVHEHGHSYTVKDGHLHVMTSQYSNNALPIAVYAPQHWDSAVIKPDEDGKYNR